MYADRKPNCTYIDNGLTKASNYRISGTRVVSKFYLVEGTLTIMHLATHLVDASLSREGLAEFLFHSYSIRDAFASEKCL
jgi:hypothetical protein